MFAPIHSLRFTLAGVFAACLALACGDSTTSPEESVLAGLAQSTVSDSTGAPPPSGPPASPTPGTFRGTVLGHETAPGVDTLETFPRLANVRVTAYPRIPSAADPLAVGPAEASVLTDANGVFLLPTLAGGEYVVTIAPAAGSEYAGVYALATAHAESSTHPWWVVLPRK